MTNFANITIIDDFSFMERNNEVCPIPDEIENILNCFKNKWSFNDFSNRDLITITKKLQLQLEQFIKKWNKYEIDFSKNNQMLSDLGAEIATYGIKTEYILFCKKLTLSRKNIDQILKHHKIIFLFYLRDIYNGLTKYIEEINKDTNILNDTFKKFKVFYLIKLIYDLFLQLLEFYNWCYQIKHQKDCIVKAFMVRKHHIHDLCFFTITNLYNASLYEPRDVIPINLFNYRLLIEENLKDALAIKAVVVENFKLYNLQLLELLELLKELKHNEIIEINFELEELSCLGDLTNPYIHQADFCFYWQIFYIRIKFNSLFANNYFNTIKIKPSSYTNYKNTVSSFFKRKFKQKEVKIYLKHIP